jgi:hypothetical protein
MGKAEIRKEALRLATGATHPMIGHMLDISKRGGAVVAISAKN